MRRRSNSNPDAASSSEGWQKYALLDVTLQAAVLLGRDHTQNVRPTKNQPFKSVKQFLQMTERFTDQAEITGLTAIDWKRSLCGKKQFCYVKELFRMRIPKPTSLPTQSSDWETPVTNQSKPGKTGSNGFGDTLSQ